MTLGEARTVAGGGLYIVEGAYSCHPKLGDYMNLRIFFQCQQGGSKEPCSEKGRRGGPGKLYQTVDSHGGGLF